MVLVSDGGSSVVGARGLQLPAPVSKGTCDTGDVKVRKRE